jgi:hypothetical protein
MTRRSRPWKDILKAKMQLVDIIKDRFDNDGQTITHDELARLHVAFNQSTRADEDVTLYGGPAVVYLRTEHAYAIVPITAKYAAFEAASEEDPNYWRMAADAVAGLGAGGPRNGWYQPTHQDDPLWLSYIGHLSKGGFQAVYHGLIQPADNPALSSPQGLARIATIATSKSSNDSPKVPERKALEARLAIE